MRVVVNLLPELDVIPRARGQRLAVGAEAHGLYVIRVPAQRRTARRVAVCLLYTSPSPRDRTRSRMPSSA